MNVEQAIKVAQGLDCERLGVGEALCIVENENLTYAQAGRPRLGSHHSKRGPRLPDLIRRAILVLIG